MIHDLHEKGQTTGYEFLKACSLRGIEVSPGSVYPLLNKLKEEGLLTSKQEAILSFIRRLADTEWTELSQVSELIQSIQKMYDSLVQFNTQNKTNPIREGEL